MPKTDGAKKAPKPKPKPVPRITRESPIHPGHMMPTEPPQLHHMEPEQRSYTQGRVAGAIESKTGGSFDMHAAVQTRVGAVLGSIGHERSEAERTGTKKLPEGYSWYNEHQQVGRDTAKATGAPLGRTIDTSAALSVRNAPENERVAAKSAMHIAMNPHQEVSISQQLAPHVGEYKRVAGGNVERTTSMLPGKRTLGSMSSKEVASLGHGASQLEQQEGGEVTHAITSELGDVTRRAAGRPAAERGMRVARGEGFTNVTDAPKTASYAVAAHSANPAEKTHNEMRLNELTYGLGKVNQSIPEQMRTAHAAAHPETGQQSMSYDEMYPGHRQKVLSAHRHDPTAEDYVMNAMTAHQAHAEGKPSWPARAALDIVGHATTKGGAGSPLGPDVQPEQMLHSVNTAATHMAARKLGLTPVATQALSWIHYRRTALGEDTGWNAQQAQVEKEQKRAAAPPKEHPGGMKGQRSLFNDKRYVTPSE